LPVPPGARDLSLGNPDPELLPDLGRALARTPLPVRLYGEPAALDELARLSREQLKADGIASESACIVSGALDGIERVIEAHLRPGDRVAVESPGYASLFDLLRARGLALDPVAIDERGMRPDSLRTVLQRGAVAALDAGRAGELRAVFDGAPHTLVIEDDHLGPVAGSDLHTTVAGRERWAATRSVAKALGPDLRLAVLVGDAQTIARVQGRQQCGPGWVSHVLQRLVLELWRDPDVHALVERACATYASRRECLLDALHERSVGAVGASGLNVWVPVGDETRVVGTLLQRGWVVAPGEPFRLAASPPAIRVTIATLRETETRQLADDLAAALAGEPASRAG
jgi:DNA-binding transcriptional MocR family regulator